MTVAELGERMSLRELMEWQAFWKIEAAERAAAERKARLPGRGRRR